MPKYYRVDMDDFERMPFGSDMDENWDGHEIVVEEQFKDEFIAEQVSRFTLYLLSILHAVETRGEKYPFSKISKKYPRETFKYYGASVICPHCGHPNGEEEWNSEYQLIHPCCLYCVGDFEMEEDEE